MRHPKTTMIIVASLVLTVFLGLAGCGEDHGDRIQGDRDRQPEQVDRHDSDRHEDRPDSDPHEDHGSDSGHEGDHGGR